MLEKMETWLLSKKENRNYKLKTQDPEVEDKKEAEEKTRTKKAVEEEDLEAVED